MVAAGLLEAYGDELAMAASTSLVDRRGDPVGEDHEYGPHQAQRDEPRVLIPPSVVWGR